MRCAMCANNFRETGLPSKRIWPRCLYLARSHHISTTTVSPRYTKSCHCNYQFLVWPTRAVTCSVWAFGHRALGHRLFPRIDSGICRKSARPFETIARAPKLRRSLCARHNIFEKVLHCLKLRGQRPTLSALCAHWQKANSSNWMRPRLRCWKISRNCVNNMGRMIWFTRYVIRKSGSRWCTPRCRGLGYPESVCHATATAGISCAG